MKDCTFCSMPNCEARNSSSKDKCRLEHSNITFNSLIKKATFVSRQLTSGDIPLTLNGEPIDIVDITLEGEQGNYHADIKVIARKEE